MVAASVRGWESGQNQDLGLELRRIPRRISKYKETYADGLSRSYTLDEASNLLTSTDRVGEVTNYIYSDFYFLWARTYPSAAGY